MKWMLQPPPAAKIMEGKVPANRSRSASGGSYGVPRSDTASLGRQVSQRQIESRPYSHITITNTTSYSPHISGQPHDRDPSTELSFTDSPSATPTRKRRPPPIKISEDPINISSISRSKTAPTKPRSTRPQLATIESSSQVVQTITSSYLSPNSQARPVSSTSSSSLHALQELVTPNSALNARVPSVSKEASVRLPLASELENSELSATTIQIPQRAKTKFPGGETFRFPALEIEERLDVPMRWSMDI